MNMNMNKKSSMIGDRSPRNALEWGDPVKRPDFYPEWLIWADPSKIPRLPDGWPMERGQWSDMMKRGIGKVRFSVSLCICLYVCARIYDCVSLYVSVCPLLRSIRPLRSTPPLQSLLPVPVLSVPLMIVMLELVGRKLLLFFTEGRVLRRRR